MRLFRRKSKEKERSASRFAHLGEPIGDDDELQEQFGLVAVYLEALEAVQVDERSASGIDLHERLREHESKVERSWRSVREGEPEVNVRGAVIASASELQMIWSEGTEPGREGRTPRDVLSDSRGG